MKKMMACIALALLMMSIFPLAFAEKGSGKEGRDDRITGMVVGDVDDSADVDEDDDSSSANGTSDDSGQRTRVRAVSVTSTGDEIRTETRERRKSDGSIEVRTRDEVRSADGRARSDSRMRTVSNADQLKLRTISKQRIEDARKKLVEVRERYEDAKDKFEDAKVKFEDARKNNDRTAVIDHAKEVLAATADRIIEHLNKIKSRVAENENIDAERAASISEGIDAEIAKIEGIKANIDSAETTQELRAIAKELREEWRRIEYRIKVFAEQVVSAKVQGVVNTVRVLEKKLDSALSAMESQGIDVDVSSLVDEFKEYVQDAKDNYQAAQDKLEEARLATSRDDIKRLSDEAKDLLDLTRENLREAHETLKDIVKAIRDAGHELKIDDDQEVEIEDDSGDDDSDSGNDSDEDSSDGNSSDNEDDDGTGTNSTQQ